MSALAVGALAIGIGLTATMFSILYGVLLRGLPFEDGDRIMAVLRTNPSLEARRQLVPIHDYLEWSEQQRSFEGLAAYHTRAVSMREGDQAERFTGTLVTANAFRALGVAPFLGRDFTPEDDAPGAPGRVMLSYRLWRDRFALDPGVVRRVVTVDGEAAEVVGVMPQDFLFPDRSDLWLPLRADPTAVPRGEGTLLTVWGRLRAGVGVAQADAELSGIAQRLAEAYPSSNRGYSAAVLPLMDLYVGAEAALFWTMMVVVSLVFLVACANVSNLLLARAAGRARELGIRKALGASRVRVMSQMIAEALALALAGGALGSGLAWVGTDAFARAIQRLNPPFFMAFELGVPVLGCLVGLAILAAVVAGGIPAWKVTAAGDVNVLGGGRGRSTLAVGSVMRALVVVDVAMSMGLLVAAGLTAKSITKLRVVDYGFDPDAIFTARIALSDAQFPDSLARRLFLEDLRARLLQTSQAQAVSLAATLPALGSQVVSFQVEGASSGDTGEAREARTAPIGPGYFDVLRLSVLMGRDFTPADGPGAEPVTIVNASFARRFLSGGSPVGRRVRVVTPSGAQRWRTIVGVAPDAWMQGVGNTSQAPAGFYVPLQQSDVRSVHILARGPSDPLTLGAPIREAVASVNPDTPLYLVKTLRERIQDGTWAFNVFGALFVAFGSCALLLASLGLYGVMAFTVSRRTAEVGVRIAIGAEVGQVLRLILRQSMSQMGLGLVLGLGVAFVISKGLEVVLFDVSATDPWVYACVTGFLALTGLVATLIPARRATRLDPLTALRSE